MTNPDGALTQGARSATARAQRKANPSVPAVLRELWLSRDLVVQFFLRDVTIRYVQAMMGFAWALLMPVLIVGAGMIFRVVVATLSGTPLDVSAIASLAIKALPWAFFSGAISLATQSIIAHAGLIGKIYFPREALPIASVLAQGVDLGIGLVALCIAFPFLNVSVTLTALWAFPVVAMLLLLTIGIALLLSCANLFFRDIKYIVQVVLSFGVFATPVFFEPQMLGPKGARILMALPLSPFIQGLDMSVIRHVSLLDHVVVESAKGPVDVWAPWMLVYMIVTSVGAFWFGVRIFRSSSSKFAEMA